MSLVKPMASHECERLISAGVFGRIVLPTPTRTEIFPVNYAVMSDAVLIRTSPGSLLDRYADGAELVFEIDEVDYERWHGWSVVVRGTGERVDEADLTSGERGSPGPPPWVSRERDIWFRLRWVELTGRKLGSGWDPTANLAVRRVWR